MNTDMDTEKTKDIRHELLRGCYVLIAAVIGAGGLIFAALIQTGGFQLTASRAPTLPVAVLASTSTPQPTYTPYPTPTPYPSFTVVRATSVPPPTLRPTATQPPPTSSTSDLSMQQEIDRLLGAGNWQCMDGFPSGISIDKLPSNFVVRPPFISVDTRNGTYRLGDTVPSSGYATGWLQTNLPNNKCSPTQTSMSRASVNQMVGSGNWYCLTGFPSGVLVKNVPPNFVVRSPAIVVDKDDARYYQNGTVPSGGLATLWFSGNLPQSECP